MLMLLAWLGFPLHHSDRFAGSFWGGVLGVTGAALMLVPLAYLVVKRNRKIKQSVTKHVSMRTLLTWHIYAGVLGPILVVLHSGHKYESPLGIALTALTLLVVVSGFVGRYLMSGFGKQIKEKKALLGELQAAYERSVIEIAAEPVAARMLKPYSSFFGRLVAGFFLSDSDDDRNHTGSPTIRLVRLAESIADVEYAIATHEDFKRWFGKWLKFHVVISLLLYVLMALHIWAAVHFGLRWFEETGRPVSKPAALMRAGDTANLPIAMPGSVNSGAAKEFFDHFGQLFRRHWRPPVKVHGIMTTVFDYQGIASEIQQPDSDYQKTVAALDRVDVRLLAGDDFEKAFWINVYNFAAMKLAAQNYPLPSIIDPKISDDPWSVNAVNIGGTGYSLKEIENAILLKKFDDRRIVFAISCAAVSCPDRTDEIFSGDRINEQLDAIIRAFLLNVDKGMAIDRESGTVTLSWIWKADQRLFGGNEQGVLRFAGQYSAPEVGQWIDQHLGDLTVKYFTHDWGLNDLALADSEPGVDERE